MNAQRFRKKRRHIAPAVVSAVFFCSQSASHDPRGVTAGVARAGFGTSAESASRRIWEGSPFFGAVLRGIIKLLLPCAAPCAVAAGRTSEDCRFRRCIRAPVNWLRAPAGGGSARKCAVYPAEKNSRTAQAAARKPAASAIKAAGMAYRVFRI